MVGDGVLAADLVVNRGCALLGHVVRTVSLQTRHRGESIGRALDARLWIPAAPPTHCNLFWGRSWLVHLTAVGYPPSLGVALHWLSSSCHLAAGLWRCTPPLAVAQLSACRCYFHFGTLPCRAAWPQVLSGAARLATWWRGVLLCLPSHPCVGKFMAFARLIVTNVRHIAAALATAVAEAALAAAAAAAAAATASRFWCRPSAAHLQGACAAVSPPRHVMTHLPPC